MYRSSGVRSSYRHNQTYTHPKLNGTEIMTPENMAFL